MDSTPPVVLTPRSDNGAVSQITSKSCQNMLFGRGLSPVIERICSLLTDPLLGQNCPAESSSKLEFTTLVRSDHRIETVHKGTSCLAQQQLQTETDTLLGPPAPDVASDVGYLWAARDWKQTPLAWFRAAFSLLKSILDMDTSKRRDTQMKELGLFSGTLLNTIHEPSALVDEWGAIPLCDIADDLLDHDRFGLLVNGNAQISRVRVLLGRALYEWGCQAFEVHKDVLRDSLFPSAQAHNTVASALSLMQDHVKQGINPLNFFDIIDFLKKGLRQQHRHPCLGSDEEQEKLLLACRAMKLGGMLLWPEWARAESVTEPLHGVGGVSPKELMTNMLRGATAMEFLEEITQNVRDDVYPFFQRFAAHTLLSGNEACIETNFDKGLEVVRSMSLFDGLLKGCGKILNEPALENYAQRIVDGAFSNMAVEAARLVKYACPYAKRVTTLSSLVDKVRQSEEQRVFMSRHVPTPLLSGYCRYKEDGTSGLGGHMMWNVLREEGCDLINSGRGVETYHHSSTARGLGKLVYPSWVSSPILSGTQLLSHLWNISIVRNPENVEFLYNNRPVNGPDDSMSRSDVALRQLYTFGGSLSYQEAISRHQDPSIPCHPPQRGPICVVKATKRLLRYLVQSDGGDYFAAHFAFKALAYHMLEPILEKAGVGDPLDEEFGRTLFKKLMLMMIEANAPLDDLIAIHGEMVDREAWVSRHVVSAMLVKIVEGGRLKHLRDLGLQAIETGVKTGIGFFSEVVEHPKIPVHIKAKFMAAMLQRINLLLVGDEHLRDLKNTWTPVPQHVLDFPWERVAHRDRDCVTTFIGFLDDSMRLSPLAAVIRDAVAKADIVRQRRLRPSTRKRVLSNGDSEPSKKLKSTHDEEVDEMDLSDPDLR